VAEATYRQARARLDMPVPLGYSAAGVVIEVGDGVSGVRTGDRVACAGHPYAGHAEIISVPRNLVVPIPPNVEFEDASFAMLGAIAMNAVRLAEPALGERVAVIGMGLLGLLALQMLRAAGGPPALRRKTQRRARISGISILSCRNRRTGRLSY